MKVRHKALAASLFTLTTTLYALNSLMQPSNNPETPSKPTPMRNSVLPDHPSRVNWTECPPISIQLPGPFFHSGESTASRYLAIAEDKKAPLCRPPTPLFVTFASNACLLEQTVLSYIAEGWPPTQIVVVDNSGMSRQNFEGRLTISNHAFLNYTLLLNSYGVNVYRSPVRNTFAQLQNMLLELARESRWKDFYTSHQDVIVRSATGSPFFHQILEEQKQARHSVNGPEKWAFYFFHYDWLAHVNVDATYDIGPWDVLIPWYPADCDYYTRTRMKGFSILDYYAGDFYDVASCLPDADRFLFSPTNSSDYFQAQEALKIMAGSKEANKAGRNTWQGRQLTRISEDFGQRFHLLVEAGRRSYRLKWGTSACDPATHRPTFFARLGSWIGW